MDRTIWIHTIWGSQGYLFRIRWTRGETKILCSLKFIGPLYNDYSKAFILVYYYQLQCLLDSRKIHQKYGWSYPIQSKCCKSTNAHSSIAFFYHCQRHQRKRNFYSIVHIFMVLHKQDWAQYRSVIFPTSKWKFQFLYRSLDN